MKRRLLVVILGVILGVTLIFSYKISNVSSSDTPTLSISTTKLQSDNFTNELGSNPAGTSKNPEIMPSQPAVEPSSPPPSTNSPKRDAPVVSPSKTITTQVPPPPPKIITPPTGGDSTMSVAILSEGFEKGLGAKWQRDMASNAYAGASSTKYALEGNFSYRVELRKDDPEVCSGKRAELEYPAEQPLQDHTYTFSTYLPNGGDEDYTLDPHGSEIIFQWHNNPDTGEAWTTPPLALHIDASRYLLVRCWDDEALTSDEKMTNEGYRDQYNLGLYSGDKGKWVTWKFHIKWGWLKSHAPILEVYKNGVQILNLDGLPNTTNDQRGVNIQFGLYKWEWGQTGDNNRSILNKRVMYFDNVSIK